MEKRLVTRIRLLRDLITYYDVLNSTQHDVRRDLDKLWVYIAVLEKSKRRPAECKTIEILLEKMDELENPTSILQLGNSISGFLRKIERAFESSGSTVHIQSSSLANQISTGLPAPQPFRWGKRTTLILVETLTTYPYEYERCAGAINRNTDFERVTADDIERRWRTILACVNAGIKHTFIAHLLTPYLQSHEREAWEVTDVVHDRLEDMFVTGCFMRTFGVTEMVEQFENRHKDITMTRGLLQHSIKAPCFTSGSEGYMHVAHANRGRRYAQ